MASLAAHHHTTNSNTDNHAVTRTYTVEQIYSPMYRHPMKTTATTTTRRNARVRVGVRVGDGDGGGFTNLDRKSDENWFIDRMTDKLDLGFRLSGQVECGAVKCVTVDRYSEDCAIEECGRTWNGHVRILMRVVHTTIPRFPIAVNNRAFVVLILDNWGASDIKHIEHENKQNTNTLNTIVDIDESILNETSEELFSEWNSLL